MTRKPLFRGIVHAQIKGSGVKAVAHFLDEIDHVEGNATVYHSLIIILFPYVIFSDIFVGFAFIHVVKVVREQAALTPQILSGSADFLAKILMLFGSHKSPSLLYQFFSALVNAKPRVYMARSSSCSSSSNAAVSRGVARARARRIFTKSSLKSFAVEVCIAVSYPRSSYLAQNFFAASCYPDIVRRKRMGAAQPIIKPVTFFPIGKVACFKIAVQEDRSCVVGI